MFSCCSFTVNPSSCPHLLQVGLEHAHIPLFREFELADEDEFALLAIAVEINDVDVLAGQILAESANDARLILAESRDDEPLRGPGLRLFLTHEPLPSHHLILAAKRLGAPDAVGQSFRLDPTPEG